MLEAANVKELLTTTPIEKRGKCKFIFQKFGVNRLSLYFCTPNSNKAYSFDT